MVSRVRALRTRKRRVPVPVRIARKIDRVSSSPRGLDKYFPRVSFFFAERGRTFRRRRGIIKAFHRADRFISRLDPAPRAELPRICANNRGRYLPCIRGETSPRLRALVKDSPGAVEITALDPGSEVHAAPRDRYRSTLETPISNQRIATRRVASIG